MAAPQVETSPGPSGSVSSWCAPEVFSPVPHPSLEVGSNHRPSAHEAAALPTELSSASGECGDRTRAPRQGRRLSKALHCRSANSPCSACGALRAVELRAGFEPATSRLRNERSGRLSYRSGMRRGCGAQGVPWVRALNRSEVQPPIEDDRAARRLAPPAGLEPTCLRLNRAAHSPGVLRGNERRETESNCWGSLPRPVFEAGSPPLGSHSPCRTSGRPRGPDRVRTGDLLRDGQTRTPLLHRTRCRDRAPGGRRASSRIRTGVICLEGRGTGPLYDARETARRRRAEPWDRTRGLRRIRSALSPLS